MDRLIKYADRGEWVSFLQTHLNSIGYSLKVDGIFGKNTLKAVNAYQESIGLDKSTVINVKKNAIKKPSMILEVFFLINKNSNKNTNTALIMNTVNV